MSALIISHPWLSGAVALSVLILLLLCFRRWHQPINPNQNQPTTNSCGPLVHVTRVTHSYIERFKTILWTVLASIVTLIVTELLHLIGGITLVVWWLAQKLSPIIPVLVTG